MFNKKNLVFLIVGLITTLVVGCTSQGGDVSGNSEENMENVVAKVNDNSISTVEYEDLVKMMKSSYESQGVDFNTEEGKTFLDQIQTQAINSLVQEEVLFQEAKEKGFEASDETVNEQIEAVKSQFPSEEEFSVELEKQNLTEDKYKEMVTKEIVISEFLQSEIKEVTISEEELQAAYDQYVDQMKQMAEQTGEETEIPDFEDSKEQLEMQLSQQNQQEQMSKIIEELLEENEVEIYI